MRLVHLHFAVAVAAMLMPNASTGGEPARRANDSDIPTVDLFDAINAGDVEVQFIGKNANEGTVKITNPGNVPVHLRLPEAFAAVPVPVLAQQGGGFGGGGGGLGGGGGGGGNQGGGGGFGGGGGGGGFGGGGGGGFFNVAPEKTRKLKVAMLCLDHGLEDPNPRVKYEFKPIDTYVDRPEVIETVKAFARGELHTGAAQAAIWHLNNDIAWEQLATKMRGPQDPRFGKRVPFFSPREIQGGMAISAEARRIIAEQRDESSGPRIDPGKDSSSSR